jgi:hypothetical protein
MPTIAVATAVRRIEIDFMEDPFEMLAAQTPSAWFPSGLAEVNLGAAPTGALIHRNAPEPSKAAIPWIGDHQTWPDRNEPHMKREVHRLLHGGEPAICL